MNGSPNFLSPFVSFDEIGYGLLVADGIGGMAARNVASQWLCAISGADSLIPCFGFRELH